MNWEDELVLALVFLAVILFFIGGALFAVRYECYQKYGRTGYELSWGAWSGCQLEVEEGRWIPADSYYFREE